MKRDDTLIRLPQYDAAITGIKELVTNSPILKYHDVNEQAHNVIPVKQGLGHHFCKRDSLQFFVSRSLLLAEQRNTQSEKEGVTMEFAYEKSNPYIWQAIQVQSGHKLLDFIFKSHCQCPKNGFSTCYRSVMLEFKHTIQEKDIAIWQHENMATEQ